MKTRTISISGTIVGADWDLLLSYLEEIVPGSTSAYTSETRFIRELAAAEKDGAAVEVRINSWGGEVFAERNMLDAFQRFEGTKRVHVAGMAMSAAADFLLKSGARATASEGAVIMFHSATSFAAGGPDAMRDEAALLDQINESSRKALLDRGVPEDRVAAAFSEGRMLTMLAAEAEKFGIVAAVTGAREPNPAKPDKDLLKKAGPEALGKFPAQAAERFARLCQLADEESGDDPATTSDDAASAESGSPATDSDTHPADDADTAAGPTPAPESGNAPASDATAPAPEDSPAEGGASSPSEPPASSPAPAVQAAAAKSSEPAPATAPAPANAAGATERLAELEKQVRAVQSASGKKIHELQTSLEAARAETAAALQKRDDAIRERDEAQAKLAQYDARVAQLTSALEGERTTRASLVGGVLAPDSETDPSVAAAGGASPHIDAYNALRTAAEKRAYFRANFAAIQAEIKAARHR